MSKYPNLIKIFLVLLWILVLTWNNGFGLQIDWWVYIVALVLWSSYLRFNKLSILFLFLLFFLNLYINHLFTISGNKLDFNVEQIVISKPELIKIINKYRYDDVGMPYQIRMIFYSKWLMIFYWLDSFFKIISPLIWSRILGFAGLFVALFGVFSTKFKYLLWLLVICLSSSLAILYDTKTAVILALPAIILILVNGIENKFVKKYWYVLLFFMTIDLILK